MVVKMGNVWDRTAEFLSDNIAAVLPIALVAFFIPTSIQGNFEAALVGAGGGLRLVFGLAQLAFAILAVWGSLAITAMALDIAGTEHPARTALRRLPATLLVSIALLLGTLLLAAPIGVTLALSGVITSAPAYHFGNLDASTAFGITIYGLVLFFVLLWLFARLVLVTPVIVRERRTFGAIPQSWRLTRGHALRIVGVLILFIIVAWVAYLAAITVFGSIFALVAGDDGEGITLAGVLTSIVAGAVQTAFSVLMPAFTAKLYLALIAEAGLRSAAPAA